MTAAAAGQHERMATNPPPERDRKMHTTGSRLLIVSAVLAAIGLVLVLLLDGTGNGIGVAVLAFACIALVAGLALSGSALVSKRSRAGKPFA